MTTPTLTPDELIRSRAFFDAAEFEEIVEDESVPCMFAESTATWALVTRCCAHVFLMCDKHLAKYRRRVDRSLAGMKRAGCPMCKEFHAPATFEAVFRVEKL